MPDAGFIVTNSPFFSLTATFAGKEIASSPNQSGSAELVNSGSWTLRFGFQPAYSDLIHDNSEAQKSTIENESREGIADDALLVSFQLNKMDEGVT